MTDRDYAIKSMKEITFQMASHAQDYLEWPFLDRLLKLDVGNIRVEFESSYEPTGPFGVKSIGEVVINTPSPAIAAAVANATGVQIRELPITPEKIFKELHK